MSINVNNAVGDLPHAVARILEDFVGAAEAAFGSDLKSIILFGSAAEGKMRATSDVNVLIVLRVFNVNKVDQVRELLEVGRSAIKLAVMFLLEDEVRAAAEAFAQKFLDIRHRRRILSGSDPFVDLEIPRSALVARLRQVLLNLTLRLRETYVSRSLLEEQLALAVAEVAGPLRSSAATLLELEGQPGVSPKEALERMATSLGGADWPGLMECVSRARETRTLPAGSAGPTLLNLMELARRMWLRAQRLS